MGLVPLVVCVVAILVLPGCAGGGSGEDVLAETAGRLGEIRSGELELALLVDPSGDGDAFGFELRGPFALGHGGSLPTLRLAYTEIANGRRTTATLFARGQRAFVERGGKRSALTPEEVEALRQAAAGLRTVGGLLRLRVEDWVEDAELSDGGEIGGAETDRVQARLDVDELADDALSLARGLGGLRALAPAVALERETLRRAARTGKIDVYTGKDDRLLRRLRAEIELGLAVPGALQDALPTIVGADVRFELTVARPTVR